MKIHHASKKVLAAALSAAMVVAFAPPSALGLTSGGTVTVEFSAGEGTGSLDSYTYTADSDGRITLSQHPGDIYDAFTNGYYDLAGYFYDQNGNGICDNDESSIEKSAFNTNNVFIWNDVKDGSNVKFVAYYDNIGLVSATETSADAGTYTLKFACSVSGAKLTYQMESSDVAEYNSNTGIVGVEADDKVTMTATSADGSATQSKIYCGYSDRSEYSVEGGPLGDFEAFATSVLNSKTADGTTTYNAVQDVKAAVEAGKADIKTRCFATSWEWKRLIPKKEVVVYRAIAAYAKTQLDALRPLAKSKDGKTYSQLSDYDYAACVEVLDELSKMIATGESGSSYAPGELLMEFYTMFQKAKSGESSQSNESTSNDAQVEFINFVVQWAKEAAAANTFVASDVEAANPVITSLQNAKSATEAKAAIEKYNKLTSVQKEIVSTADVIAAYEIIADAADSDAAAAAAAQSAAAAASEAAAKANKEAAAAKEEAAAAKKEIEQKAAEVEQANKNVEQAQAEATAAKKEAEQANQKTAAAELKAVNAQDKAAALALTGKTVTAKAKAGKKAQGKKFSYKLAASESGATATYAKASGSKYIKVSANGKVIFAKVKVGKKAKTYKAKVTVTFGTQTVTRTIKYVVKKK